MEAGGEPRALPADGDPVDPEWRIYARSAGDDKAPFPTLLAALDALEDAGITRTSNLVFLFDGEEEAGSPHLGDYIQQARDRLDVDVWLFCDGPVHQSGRPQLTFGVRGVTGLAVTLYGATRSLHSGHYGNWAPQPAEMLAQLLASMKDPTTGQVKIQGFYDTVEPIGPQERAALEALPDYDPQLMEEMGMRWHEGPENESLPERLLYPSLTVKGLSSGNVGARARNVIPSTATASLGIRLVSGNDPDHMLDLVEDHIRAQGYHIVREDPDMETRLAWDRVAKVTRGGGYKAARTPMDTPVVQSVIGAARQAAGDELVLVPALGGSLPLFYFTDDMGAPAVIAPIANHDDNQHAADENVRVGNLWYGMDLYAALLTMPAREAMD
jgi:acetylornithine deacetylase/succinyl-diaminopimelate desuccinylase-like protein